VTVVSDIHKKCGPLGGIHAALTHIRANACCIVSCDIPFITPQLLYYLVDAWAGTVAVPAMDGQLHPLCGVYGRKVLPLLQDYLQCGHRSVHEFLMEVRAKTVPITTDLPFFHPSLLFNINTPEDLRQAQSM
jgi:molybdopterin-guanine dinucleotide biosynthesis protein A